MQNFFWAQGLDFAPDFSKIEIVLRDTQAGLTTGMTTDRKIFDFLPRHGIMAKTEYPGVVQLIERVVWERVAPPSSRKTPCPQSLDTPEIQAISP